MSEKRNTKPVVLRLNCMLILMLLSILSSQLCYAQVEVTNIDKIPGYEVRIHSLGIDKSTGLLKKLISETMSYERLNDADTRDWEKPYGFPITANLHGQDYTYEDAYIVQVAEDANAVLLIQMESTNKLNPSPDMYVKYYQPPNQLKWEKSYKVADHTFSPYVQLSPMGYVVEIDTDGNLNLYDSAGEKYASNQLFDAGSMSADMLNSVVRIKGFIYKDGRNLNFSVDGGTFAYIVTGTQIHEGINGSKVFVFRDTGDLSLVKDFPEYPYGDIIVSPNGDRIVVSLNSIGKGKYRDKANAKLFLFSNNGDIVKEIEARCWDIAFSENGKYIIVNDMGKAAYVLEAESGKRLWNYDGSEGKRVLGIAINEKRGITGLILDNGRGSLSTEYKLVFFDFSGRKLGYIELYMMELINGRPIEYSLMFDSDGKNFAINIEKKIIFGKIE